MMNVGSGAAEGSATSGLAGESGEDALAAELLRDGPDGPVEYLDDYLEYWVQVQPHARAHTFLDFSTDRAGVARTLTFAELDEWSRAVAARIQAVGNPGERVAVLTPQGTEYVVGTVAALRSGLIGVPLFSPDLFGHGDRVARVLEDCEPTVLLTTSDKLELATELAAGRATVICVDELEGEAGSALAAAYRTPPDRSPATAHICSTRPDRRAPRPGVVLTHANLVSQRAPAQGRPRLALPGRRRPSAGRRCSTTWACSSAPSDPCSSARTASCSIRSPSSRTRCAGSARWPITTR